MNSQPLSKLKGNRKPKPRKPIIKPKETYLEEWTGRTVSLKLITSEIVTGKLLGVRKYEILIQLPDNSKAVIFKHSITYAVKEEEGEMKNEV